MSTLILVTLQKQVQKMSSVSYLSEVLLAVFPSPGASTEGGPIIKCCLAAGNPGVIVQARATTKNFAPSVRLFETSVFRTINEGGFVRPVILTIPKLESTCRSSNLWDFARISGKKVVRNFVNRLLLCLKLRFHTQHQLQ
jgi:hypothetical protein